MATTWKDCLDQFDQAVKVIPDSSDATLDSVVKHLDSQLMLLRNATGNGFDLMTNIAGKLDSTVPTIEAKMEAKTETITQAITAEVNPGLRSNGQPTLGSKVDTIAAATEGTITAMKMELESKWQLMSQTVETLNGSVNDIIAKLNNVKTADGGPVIGTSNGFSKNNSILECQSVKGLEKIGDDRTKYRGWLKTVKNVLGPLMDTDDWRFWMEIAEKEYSQPEKIEEAGKTKEPMRAQSYKPVGKLFKAIFTDKLEPHSDAFRIIDRNDKDGVMGFCELHRHFMEITGEGQTDLMNWLMQPTMPTKDEQMLPFIEKWEERHRDAIARGMMAIPEPYWLPY